MDKTEMAIWPGWETLRMIGRGSFGAVYEIQRDIFGDIEKAALKVISIPQNSSDIDELYSDGYNDQSITATFQSHLKSILAEYTLMRKLSDCVNIVSCDDVRYVQHNDGIGWDIYIKMELLTPLTKALPAAIPEDAALTLGRDLCRALVACGRHGIIHRDIKPQNIFVSANGDYKLGDFGIAKTVEKTMGGTKIGTYKYMAPEVYHNQPYGTASDIYSLGLVLYWMLNERRMPFLPLPPQVITAHQDEAARHRRLSGEPLPPPAHGSDALKQIVLKACAFDPAQRYASAQEMLQALEMLGAAAPIPMDIPMRAPMPQAVPVQPEDATVGVFGGRYASDATGVLPSKPQAEDATVVLFGAADPLPQQELSEEETMVIFSAPPAPPQPPVSQQNPEPEDFSQIFVQEPPVQAPPPAQEKKKKKLPPLMTVFAAVASLVVFYLLLAEAFISRLISGCIMLAAVIDGIRPLMHEVVTFLCSLIGGSYDLAAQTRMGVDLNPSMAACSLGSAIYLTLSALILLLAPIAAGAAWSVAAFRKDSRTLSTRSRQNHTVKKVVLIAVSLILYFFAFEPLVSQCITGGIMLSAKYPSIRGFMKGILAFFKALIGATTNQHGMVSTHYGIDLNPMVAETNLVNAIYLTLPSLTALFAPIIAGICMLVKAIGKKKAGRK